MSEEQVKRGNWKLWVMIAFVMFPITLYCIWKVGGLRDSFFNFRGSSSENLLPILDRIGGEEGASSNFESIANRIAKSTVVVFTEVKSREGRRVQVITEIHKLRSDVEFHYQVGDEIGRPVEGNSASQFISFYRGSPGDLPSSMSIHAGYILKQKELPVRMVRQLIAEVKSDLRALSHDDLAIGLRGVKRETFDELVSQSDYVVLTKNEVRVNSLCALATEIFHLKDEVTVYVMIGDQVGSPIEMKEGTLYGEAGMSFFKGGYLSSTIVIHEGRLSNFGDMPLEFALTKLRLARTGDQ